MGKIRQGVTAFVPVEVNAILHGCRKCGQPVPVNGLVGKTTCPHCQGSVTVPTRLWQRALRAVNVGALVDGDAVPIASSPGPPTPPLACVPRPPLK